MRHIFAQLKPDDFTKVPKPGLDTAHVQNILQIVFGVMGGVALIIFMLAGLKYIASRGDPSAVAKAKNTILYAVIGIVVATFAFSIVTFVVRSV